MRSNALPMSSKANTLSIGSLSWRDFHRRPDIVAHLVEDLADFLDRAGAEGDADIVDAARGVEVEVEIAMGAAEPADIDDAALDLGRLEVLVGDRARDLVDDEVDAFAIGGLKHLVDPAGILGIAPRGRRRIPSSGRGASASVEEPITVFAPLNLAICIAIRPTPELAPWINTDCPGCSRRW